MEAAAGGSLPAVLGSCSRTAALQAGGGSQNDPPLPLNLTKSGRSTSKQPRVAIRSAQPSTCGRISCLILTARYRTPRNVLSAAGYRRLVDVTLQERAMEESGDEGADDGRDPEEPELVDRPATDEERGRGATRRIHRGVGDRNADEMDERERETDREAGEADRGTLVGGAENDDRNMKVITTSQTSAEARLYLPGECSP